MGAVKKNFRWNITDERALDALETLSNLSIVRGVTLNEALTEALQSDNYKYVLQYSIQGITLVSESKLMIHLELQGTPVSRRTLNIHRGFGHLEGMFWQDNDDRLVYNLELCLNHYKKGFRHE